ncbi:MAG: hypothetical protein GC150_16615 [Rhizobiales bacterium]|nr:hypothetical protein [Hyphomicrobiales bacterium]
MASAEGLSRASLAPQDVGAGLGVGALRRLSALFALPVIIGLLALQALDAVPSPAGLAAAMPEPDRDRLSPATAEAGAAAPLDRLLARELVLSAYSGVSYTHDSVVSIESPDGTFTELDDVSWNGEPFRNPIYYGMRAGGWLGGLPFGGVIDFTHAKALAQLDNMVTVRRYAKGSLALPNETRERLRDVYSKLEFSHGHNILMATGLYRLPLASARLSPYVGLGLGTSVPHVEIQRAGSETRTYGYQTVGPAGQVLLGLEVRLATTSVFVEYKFSASHYAPSLAEPAGGRLVAQLLTHHLIGGFSIRTGGPARLAR